MSESNPPNGLTDAERARLEERLTNLLTMIERLNAEAKLIVAELAADEAFRRRQPGQVYRFPPPSGWTGEGEPPSGPTDQGSV